MGKHKGFKWCCMCMMLACVAGLGAQTPVRTFSAKFMTRFHAKMGSDRVRVLYVLPQSIEGRQRIDSIVYSVKPDRVFEEAGVKYAEYDLKRPLPQGVLSFQIFGEVYTYDLKRTPVVADLPAMTDSMWLRAERGMECDNPDIVATAKTLVGHDQLSTLKNIYDFVRGHARYWLHNENMGAVAFLHRDAGDCTDFTDLFVSLCRALGIPARHVTGLNPQQEGTTIGGHSFPEVYVEHRGWVLFDPTPGNDAEFDTLTRPYIIFTNQRNPSLFGNSGFFYYYWWWGAKTSLQTEYVVSLR